MVASNVCISSLVQKKLVHTQSEAGFIAGWRQNETVICVDCGTTTEFFLPGLCIVGYFCYLTSPPANDKELSILCRHRLVEEFKLQDEAAVVFFVYKESSSITSKQSVDVKLYSPYYNSFEEIIANNEADFSSSVLLRVQGHLPVLFEASEDQEKLEENLDMAIERVKSVFHNDIPVYAIENTSVLLRSTAAEGASEMKCEELNVLSGHSTQNSQSKSKKTTNEKIPVNFKVLLQTTGDVALQNNVNHTLVIHCQRRQFQCVSMSLPIDVILVAQKSDTASDIYKLLTEGILSQIDKLVICLKQYSKGCKYSVLEIFHFLHPDWEFPVSIIYPQDKDDKELEQYRKSVHSHLLLPMDRPLLRKINRYTFDGQSFRGYLFNPHIGLPPSGVQDGKIAIVYGKYTYHHYMQDHINDEGWGCAYRSLQTVASWFYHQGYVARCVPSHKEIQQALVDVGDKPASFVGSRQWIGSQEVSYCLNHLLGVTSKILFVNQGADLATKGSELLSHFQNHGTPVMIGGGVLAHTILGVDFNQNTGDIKFLVLDPHYTSSEDLSVIQNKGWCGWKNVNFWDQTAFYNLCLPQRPLVI